MSDKQEIEITFQWIEEKQKLRKTFQFKLDKDKKNSVTIGRKPNYECDLCLEDPYVEWVHAEIFWKDKNQKDENQEQGFYLKSNISGNNCLKVDNYIEVIGQIVQNDEKPEDKEVKRSPVIFPKTLALKIENLFDQLYKLLNHKYKIDSKKSKKEKLKEVKLEVDYRIRIGKTLLKVVSISLCEETNPNPPQENLCKRLWKHFLNFIQSKLLWRRFVASCIDFVISCMLCWGIFILLLFLYEHYYDWVGIFFDLLSKNLYFLYLLLLSPFILYPTFCEFKFHTTAKEENYKDKSIKLKIRPFSRRASFGKRLLGIYVTELNHESISIFRSIARCFCQPLFIFGYLFLIDPIQKFLLPRLGFMPNSIDGPVIFCLSIILIIINFIMLILTKNDQSLRDWITKTKIVERQEVPLWNIVVKIKGFLFKRWLPIFLFSIVLFLIVGYSPEDYYDKGDKHFLLGNEYYKQQKYNDAIQEYDQAIKPYKIAEKLDRLDNKSSRKPHSASAAHAQYNKGLANSKLGKNKDAIKDFKKAKTLFEEQYDKKGSKSADDRSVQLQSKVKENKK